jgi:DNA adenine methylase
VLNRYSPLRYPGGKGKLASYMAAVFDINRLNDGHYVEPYAGGAGVALALLFMEHASHIHINDLNKGVHSFWHAILNEPDAFLQKLNDTPVNVGEWLQQKRILNNQETETKLDVGFAMFFLNRTNRSGIVNAGVIGGKNQTGNWKIDARFNKLELSRRIEKIASFRNRISLYNLDACELIRVITPSLPINSLIYFDPPYFMKGDSLYENHYKDNDHAILGNFIETEVKHNWIVSYDNVKPIREIYSKYRQLTYAIGYSAREVYNGSEVIIYSHGMNIPETQNPLKMSG